ncbi:MAG: YdeI/OmpD-associated family protein [Flavobacteriales bacterium]|nr:YdeI/OmpD-associated family protein [Flavobacteriales bacterium]MCX7769370.1 YdeI/OmpD-associated family protein [Flavobacteriales bacterium]MDW8410881.1 YdeI/OmpD-associated family protein [Flavobacteriales bacterium]
MGSESIPGGTLHEAPDDLSQVFKEMPEVLERWKSLTPLARNEWICWIISAAKPQTRSKRIKQLTTQLLSGIRRPCCWPGCPHHNPKTARWHGSSVGKKL